MRPIRKRIISAARLTAALLCTALLCGCTADIKPIAGTEEELRAVGTVGKREVLYDELRYVTLNCKEEMKQEYGGTVWDDAATAESHREELQSRVYDLLVSSYYGVVAMADEYYVGGSDAMLKEENINKAVSAQINELAGSLGGRKAYKSALAENYLTDRLYRFYSGCEECATELLYILKTDLQLIPYADADVEKLLYSEKFIRTNHVFIQGQTEESRKLAETVRDTLKASDDPEKEIILLKGKYDSDFTLTTTHGKYFARYTTDYGDDYETAAFALRVGEISDVIKGTDGSGEYIPGYFVILRLAPENEWIEKNFEDFSEAMIGSEFNRMLEEFRAKLTFVPNDYGREIDLLAIR